MKSPRLPPTHRTYSALVQRGGRVALPPDLSTFRLGQRVFYFFVRGREVGFRTKPKGLVRGAPAVQPHPAHRADPGFLRSADARRVPRGMTRAAASPEIPAPRPEPAQHRRQVHEKARDQAHHLFIALPDNP